MPIAFQNGGNMINVKQPYIKLGDGAWYPAKSVSVMVSGLGWKEVWPSTRTYIHTGLGIGMSIAACFGYPSTPAEFIFINNGSIGSAEGGWALVTGTFPAGSKLTIINNGYIQGAGGRGASYSGAFTSVTVRQGRDNSRTVYTGVIYNNATAGSHALLLQYPTNLQNNGYIWGGGGGGGASVERGGSNDNLANGGGGAGIPGGLANLSPYRTDYNYLASAATQFAGGTCGWSPSGDGGGPGAAGQNFTADIGKSDKTKCNGAGPGYSIGSTGYLTAITGNNSNQIRGLMS